MTDYDKKNSNKEKHDKAVIEAFKKRMDGSMVDLSKLPYKDAIFVKALIECLKETTLRFKVPKMKEFLKRFKQETQTKEQDLIFLNSVTEQKSLTNYPPYNPKSLNTKGEGKYSYEAAANLAALSDPLPPKKPKKNKFRYQCGRCGRIGHNRRSCTFKTHVNGGTLIRKPKRKKK
jgi:hypothetical protein